MSGKNKILKKVFALICLAGLCVSVNAATNGRCYALGQPFFVGDILNSAGQGWVMLYHLDKMQGTADFTGPTGKPGPVILIKSLGDNFAMGATLNTFDRRTGGSVLASTGFLNKAILFTPEPDVTQQRFPNWPQLHFGLKIGEQRIGLDAFFETQNYGKNSNSDILDTITNVTGTSEFKQKTAINNVGGKISARFAFGNLAWNPWFCYGVPYLDGSVSDVLTSTKTDTVIQNTTDMIFSMNKEDRLLTFGSCLDYTFGDWGWGIIGAWYRNETFQFKGEVTEKQTLNSSILYQHDSTRVSPRYNNSFYDYFISITPNVFENLTVAFEYQGGFSILDQKFEDKSQTDTTITTYYNDFIIALERPITVNRKLIDVLTARGSLRYAVGRQIEKTTKPDGSVLEFVKSMSTNYEQLEGMAIFFGFGYQKKRVTVDMAMRLLLWNQLGIVTGPPPAAITFTVDLHK